MIHTLSPALLKFGSFEIRWYGLMYVLGFIVGQYILKHLAKKRFFPVSKESVETLVTYLLIGLFLGARLVYVFVYNWDLYKEAPWEVFMVWQGGLSFHGGLLGFIVAALIFAKKQKISFWQVADSLTVAATPGIFFGRIGNFINGELFGRQTELAWGIIFENTGGGPFPRHPSQLYEAFGEGAFLFLLLWFLHKKVKNHGILTAIFVMGYAVIRFAIEFAREPDAQLGFLWGGVTMGQILCTLMAILGGIFWILSQKQGVRVERGL